MTRNCLRYLKKHSYRRNMVSDSATFDKSPCDNTRVDICIYCSFFPKLVHFENSFCHVQTAIIFFWTSADKPTRKRHISYHTVNIYVYSVANLVFLFICQFYNIENAALGFFQRSGSVTLSLTYFERIKGNSTTLKFHGMYFIFISKEYFRSIGFFFA